MELVETGNVYQTKMKGRCRCRTVDVRDHHDACLWCAVNVTLDFHCSGSWQLVKVASHEENWHRIDGGKRGSY